VRPFKEIEFLANQALTQASIDHQIELYKHSWDKEAINWADLKVVDIEYFEGMSGATGYRVYIEEGQSPKLEGFVAQYLKDSGYPDIEVRTEW
jgi:hypothetical protein